MYRIVNVTDKDGNVKQEFINELKVIHPNLIGEILNKEVLKGDLFLSYLCFKWADDSNKMLATSMVTDYMEDGNKIIVTTMNSIYTFEKVKE